MSTTATQLIAGIPLTNNALYHRIRFAVGDPAACVTQTKPDGTQVTTLIVRDIEMARARSVARVDHVLCPADVAPESGLSGDREIATAQATAEFLRRQGEQHVTADRSLPLIFADCAREAGIDLVCDRDLGILDRRSKDEQEIEWLQAAQRTTERVIQRACERVASCSVDASGVLIDDGSPLTSERLKSAIEIWLLEAGFSNPHGCIVAGGPIGADCHHAGAGPLRTQEPVIIDVFPRDPASRYHGDCTRTVVHGDVPPEVAAMHAAVVAAKEAATTRTRSGVTGDAVYQATIDVIQQHGYHVGLPADDAPEAFCSMPHGTGHGIGLDVHEPPLIDRGGPPLVAGDVVTIEPGLYCAAIGGIRVEDMVVVTDAEARNLNSISESLCWA